MRVKDIYNSKLADPKAKLSCSRENYVTNKKITIGELERYIEYYLEYKEQTEAYNNLKLFVEDIFHDLRKFNGQLKMKNSTMYRKANSGAKGAGQFLDLSRNMTAICSYMTLRLNAYDFTYNEELLKASGQSSYNIYKIFDKVKHCLEDKAKERKLKIEITCNGECGDIKAYDSIELLPYILLDNAVKYSETRSCIQVDIWDTPSETRFTVTSQSPQLQPGENDKIFKRGYRGENAKQMTEEGLGIGLYTAKRICEIHDGNISATEKYDFQKNVNNFIIDIQLNKSYNI